MSDIKYPHLFSPITLAGTVFRNRIFASPTGTAYMSSQHYPIQETFAYYERKAIGGAASVCVGDAVVCSKHGRFNNGHIVLDDPGGASALSRLADSISRHGAVASIELSHSGSHAHSSAREGNQLYGPMEYTTAAGFHVEAMNDDKIYEIVDQFAKAALAAKRSGFGMVTVHGGHGWLLTEFMSPVSNRRTDKWGGSPENRCRFAVEVCKAIRKAVGPNFPIEMRISGSECHPSGYDIDEGVEIAKQLDGHLDLIHVSAGSHEIWDVFTVTHPDMFLPDGANVRFAAEIKKHVKTAVATVGALADPELMEEIIASGQADVVELARGLIADPDLPLKARTGRSDEINGCMRCLTCFSNHMSKGQFICAINPVIGREIENNWIVQPAVKKQVLIAGGGIGGMQAALTAAERGHEVILCEKTGELGGALNCEHDVPFKKHLTEYLRRQERKLRAAGVDIRLNTEVTKEYAESIAPDVIIAALGSRPIVPGIPGIDGANVVGAEEVYLDPEKAGKRVVILGGGLVGTELAAYLAGLGREVEIVEMAPAMGDGGNMLHGLAIRLELARKNVKVNLSVKALEINEKGLVGEGPDGKQLFEADTVVYAAGQSPLRSEAEELRFAAPEFYQIGDCLTPKNIADATNLAYNTARDIGRF
ncbi:MAG: NAD(P)/FAD-dependent oxidoreductase [Oscillospiraceae bacterium]|nr:NAD(P)/FAD-dependent oxidoreductase [Oscillospiraceae bacterium]